MAHPLSTRSQLAALLARQANRKAKPSAMHALTVAGFARCHVRRPGLGVVVAHEFPMRTTKLVAREWRGLGVTCARCLRVRDTEPRASELAAMRARRTVRT